MNERFTKLEQNESYSVKLNDLNVTEITYSRLRNLGNYENEKLDITVHVNENESPENIVKKLRELVKQYLNIKE